MKIKTFKSQLLFVPHLGATSPGHSCALKYFHFFFFMCKDQDVRPFSFLQFWISSNQCNTTWQGVYFRERNLPGVSSFCQESSNLGPPPVQLPSSHRVKVTHAFSFLSDPKTTTLLRLFTYESTWNVFSLSLYFTLSVRVFRLPHTPPIIAVSSNIFRSISIAIYMIELFQDGGINLKPHHILNFWKHFLEHYISWSMVG